MARPGMAVIFGASSLAQVAFCPVASRLCYHYERLPVLIVGLLLLSLGCLVFGTGHSLWLMGVARLLQASQIYRFSPFIVVHNHHGRLCPDLFYSLDHLSLVRRPWTAGAESPGRVAWCRLQGVGGACILVGGMALVGPSRFGWSTIPTVPTVGMWGGGR
jgi:MFS family permease